MGLFTNYSLPTGIWKTIKNSLILLGPALVAFLAALPPSVQLEYGFPIGIALYFLKNLYENTGSRAA